MTAALMESRARLELGERRLRAIADNMPACIAYIDKSETYRFANAAYKPRCSACRTRSVVGRTLTEIDRRGAARRNSAGPTS